ncbi:unnamed protein product, partial [Polarella glacialis]
YLRQPYDDNYVDESFLDSLILNAHVRRYEYLSLCRGASGVVRQLCLVATFVSVWWRVQQATWEFSSLFFLDVLLFVLDYASGLAFGAKGSQDLWPSERLLADLRSSAKILRIAAPLWVMAPMLRTLTSSWSDDTIATLASCLLALHVILYDYGGAAGETPGALVPPPSPKSSCSPPSSSSTSSLPGGAVALNASILAATILASRLQTAEQVFAFMSFAMEVFAFFPRFSGSLQQRSPTAHALVLTPTLALVAFLLLGPSTTACMLLITLLLIGLVGPALFMWVQRYKAEIQGPWDIAHVAPFNSSGG